MEPKPKALNKIKETCLYVKDLKVAQSFYMDILELDLISFVPQRHVFFRVGEDVLLCFDPKATEAEATLPPHFAYGKQHIAFEVGKEDYQMWKEKLLRAGIQITHEHHWREDLYSFYFEDPDGNVLEILMPGIWG